jgi:hypothetical protein
VPEQEGSTTVTMIQVPEQDGSNNNGAWAVVQIRSA